MCVSQSVVSDSLQPHGLEPAMLLCPWDSPGKNIGVGAIPFSRRILQALLNLYLAYEIKLYKHC